MKLAIDILIQRRNDLSKGVRDATYNVNYYQAEARKSRAIAESNEKEARRKEVSAQHACLNRNQLQAQLNEIDSAIAKLES